MKSFLISLLSVLSLLQSGCGYRLGYDGTLTQYDTISVPFVEGDEEGLLTTLLVKELERVGPFSYQPDGGSLTLCISLADFCDENIGFRYDCKKDGKLSKDIIPTETRLWIEAVVKLVDSCSGEVVLGPTRIVSFIEYDHTYYSTRNGINVFSLGQLTDVDEATSAAMYPLYRSLANKIADYVNYQ